ncbi:MAG: S53 family serine peptidase [Thaumarchaeota archaeon]|nr:S53 family serine peptidase [Nitrososphaerota archaeon]
MSSNERSKAALRGSERSPVVGASETVQAAGPERLEISIILRPNQDTLQSLTLLSDDLCRSSLRGRSHLSHEEFAARSYGSNEKDIQLVADFAKDKGIDISISSSRRTALLSGSAGHLSELFGVKLRRYTHPITRRSFRGRAGSIHVPSELVEVVRAVLGFDDRPQARTHFRPLLPGQAAISSYTPREVAKLYQFPLTLDGTGQSIGIIELGGGYVQSDLDTYFSDLGINVPNIVSVSVDGATNSPTGDPSGPDGEVMLDIEVAGSIAPAAQITVYFAPNTDKGFLDAVTTAIHDSQNKPSVISVSWGSAENTWTSQAMGAFNQAFQDSSTLGITVCAASGDGGSSDGESDGLAHVDFPSSAPYVLGCGGTRLSSNGKVITSEVVWNDQSLGGGATGGGVSNVFQLPNWQADSDVPPSANPGGRVGRGVPDVSGNADPATGYVVRVDGQATVFGGTSAVAPLWASLFTLINQKLQQPVGYANRFFYEKLVTTTSNKIRERGFDDITQGNNGAYQARVGWDACTGLGSPDGSKLIAAI